MRLIDTHTHLDFPDFDADRGEVLARSRQLGVERLVVLGVYQANWQRLWDLVQHEDGLYAAFGLHPVYLDQHQPAHPEQLRDWLQRLAGHPQLCAVGEFGLDYFIARLDRIEQRATHRKLPLAFSNELYTLREHIALVRRRLLRLAESVTRP